MGAGLPQSFDYRDQPGVEVKTDPKWRLEREKLNDLLTPKEVRFRYIVCTHFGSNSQEVLSMPWNERSAMFPDPS